MIFKWELCDSEECDCGDVSQTIKHIISVCPIRAFKGTMKDIHLARNDAVKWTEN